MEQEKFRVPEDMFPISTISQFEKAELFLESDFHKSKLIEECQGIISKDEMENVEIMAIALMDFFFDKNEEIRCLWSFDVKHASLLTFQNSNLQEVISGNLTL
ncbi:hypothetical protein DAPPUDRAFT_333116 [Daphnia pulex]|uniref:Uncharacterized protein n=1 Tax=Daphnia pulex TaxID=6669 RepID=E9HRW8_DAPPU|nr:hypothetical protein DAPPUDRAFT_333116 [Daphnia pulex]|eukprot:EFX65519.1 hypothetical protein DAPPUDRAFT_333116 [Daphnia pulex]